MHNLA